MKDDVWFPVVAIAIVLLVAIGILVVRAHFEAATFNKFSLTKATFWDALWADLRVLPD